MLALYARCYFLFNFSTRTSSKRHGKEQLQRRPLISQAEKFRQIASLFHFGNFVLINTFILDIISSLSVPARAYSVSVLNGNFQ